MHGGAIGGPAVAAVIAVNFAKAILQQFRAVRHPHAFQGKVYKDAEKLPVAVRDGVGVDLPQPCGKVLFFGIRKRGPQLFRCGEDAAGNSRHLHITLVVFPGGAPVFGVFRVGAGGKTLAVDFSNSGSEPPPTQKGTSAHSGRLKASSSMAFWL